MTGKIIPVDMEVLATIEDVKTKLKDKEGVPFDRQTLVFKGQKLHNGHILSECNIVMKSEIHLTTENKVCKIMLELGRK